MILFLPSLRIAKCISENHNTSGLLTMDDAPLFNTKITISILNGAKRTIDKVVMTDKNGEYKAKLYYSTYSGSYLFGPEKCNFILEKLHLKIQMNGKKEIFEEFIMISNNKTTYNKQFKNGQLNAAL